MSCVYELVIVNKDTEKIVDSVCCFDGETKIQDLTDICHQVANDGLWISEKHYVRLTDETRLSLYIIDDGIKIKYV